MNNDLTRICLSVPAGDVAIFDEALEPFVDSLLWSVDDDAPLSLMEGFTTNPVDENLLAAAVQGAAARAGIEAPALTVEPVAERDWVMENIRQFPAFSHAGFYIYGSHVTDPPPPGTIPLRIDQGAAFGTGRHATTAGCLEAISWLAKKESPRRILDMGTGSGILALAMAAIWRRPVVAADIDARAVRVAVENARINKMPFAINAVAGNGFMALANSRERFDLITANILARPLVGMAAQMRARCQPGGALVLSGLLERDERMVLAAYIRAGFRLEKRITIDGWLTMVLRKKGAGEKP